MIRPLTLMSLMTTLTVALGSSLAVHQPQPLPDISSAPQTPVTASPALYTTTISDVEPTWEQLEQTEEGVVQWEGSSLCGAEAEYNDWRDAVVDTPNLAITPAVEPTECLRYNGSEWEAGGSIDIDEDYLNNAIQAVMIANGMAIPGKCQHLRTELPDCANCGERLNKREILFDEDIAECSDGKVLYVEIGLR